MQILYPQKTEDNVIAGMCDTPGNDNLTLESPIPASWCLSDSQLKFITSLIKDGTNN